MDTSSNENKPELSRGTAPVNIDNQEPTGLEGIVKVHNNLDPGAPSEIPVNPFLEEYLGRVSSMYALKVWSWSNTATRGTHLVENYWVSPGLDFVKSSEVPYFVHEMYKYLYYTGVFGLRLEVVGNPAYRGALRIKRTFSSTINSSLKTPEARNIIDFHVDGGNKIVDWELRPGAYSNYKFCFPPKELSLTTGNFLDFYYENLSIEIISPLAAPGIYPSTVSVVLYIIPIEVKFEVRRNNLTKLLPTKQREFSNSEGKKVTETYSFEKHPRAFIKKHE